MRNELRKNSSMPPGLRAVRRNLRKILTAAGLLVTFTGHTQSIQWAHGLGSANDDYAMRATTDQFSNKLVVGYFSGTITDGSVSITSNGGSDMFVIKYNCEGVAQWGYAIGSSSGTTDQEQGRDVKTDRLGNVYVTGVVYTGISTTGALNVNVGGLGGGSTITSSSPMNKEIVTAKYAPDGTLIWARVVGDVGEDGGNGIAVNDRYCYVTGFFESSSPLSAGTATIDGYTVSNQGAKDVFVMEFNTGDGTGNWVMSGGGPGHDGGHAVDLDNKSAYGNGGNVYVEGHYGHSYYGSDCQFGSLTALPTVTINSRQNSFLAKIDRSATPAWLWSVALYSPASPQTNIYANDVRTDYNNNVTVVGFFESDTYFQQVGGSDIHVGTGTSSSEDAFIVRYNSSGNYLDYTRSQSVYDEEAYGVSVNTANEIFVIGDFENTVTFPTTSSTVSLSATGGGSFDVYVQKFDVNLDAMTGTGQAFGGTGSDRGTGVVEEHTNDGMICGNFQSTMSVGSYSLTSAGSNDAFICHYSVMSCCPSTLEIRAKNAQTISSDEIWAGKYLIYGDIVVDGAVLDLTNVDLIFAPCVGISVINGGRIVAYNSVFRTCTSDEPWRGFSFDLTATGIINSCMFVNAYRGIMLDHTNQDNAYGTGVKIIHNNFQNNRIGVYADHATMVEPFTNNQFVVDDNSGNFNLCDVTPAYGNDHYGIYSDYSTFLGGISQNTFEFNASTFGGTAVRTVMGIHFGVSFGTVSANNFTNLDRSMEIIDNSIVHPQGMGVRFENNIIEVKRDFATGHEQVGVYQCTSPVLIKNNELTCTRGELQGTLNIAIRLYQATGAYVAQNTVKGFRQGIVCAASTAILVSENILINQSELGIGLWDCYYTTVSCNQIDMDDMYFPGRYGIFISHGPPTVIPDPLPAFIDTYIKVYNNCITDAQAGIYMYNSSGLPFLMAEIRNNFMYNYSNFGVGNWQYYPNPIGVGAADPGLNTFQSNSVGVPDITSTTGFGVLNVWGNWPSVLVTNPGVIVNFPFVPVHSTASCAKQTSEIDPWSVPGPTFGQRLEESVNQKYKCNDADYLEIPLDALFMEHPVLRDNFVNDLMKHKDEPTFTSTLVSVMQILLLSDKGEAIRFNAAMQAAVWVTASQKAWLNYSVALAGTDYNQAGGYLQHISPASASEQERVYLELINLKLISGAVPSATLFDQGTLASLDAIASDIQNPNCNLAIHILKQTHGKYQYRAPVHAIISPEVPTNLVTTDVDRVALLTYPNPAHAQVTVEYHRPKPDMATLTITTLMGVQVGSYVYGPADLTLTIDLSNLKPGVYIGTLDNGMDEKQTVKIVKQ